MWYRSIETAATREQIWGNYDDDRPVASSPDSSVVVGCDVLWDCGWSVSPL